MHQTPPQDLDLASKKTSVPSRLPIPTETGLLKDDSGNEVVDRVTLKTTVAY